MCFNRPGGSSSATVSSILSSSCSPTALLILSTDLRRLHEATQRHKGVLSHPVAFPAGLGSLAQTEQEGDKNRRALRSHHSWAGSSGLLGLGAAALGKRQDGVASLGQQEPLHKAGHQDSERFT